MNAPAPAFLDRADRIYLRDLAEPTTPMGVAQQRLMVVMLLFMLVTGVIAARLVQICLFGGNDGKGNAVATAPRGTVVDRNGTPLATTIKLWTVAINPRKILGDREGLAVKLAALMPERSVADYRRMIRSGKAFFYLRRPAPPELAAAVNALGEPGMVLLTEPRRLFPQGLLAGHVLGYSQMTAHGLTGIGVERYFDADLARGKPVQLSLDTRVQAALEDEIARRMGETQAVGGAGVVLDVDTGEVLGMASLPDINPNAPLQQLGDPARAHDMLNKVTMSTYELGSTFKMLTFANAFENGMLGDLSQKFDVTHPLHVGGHTIHDDEPKKRWLTVPEIMTFSSNIGTAQIADQLGPDRIKAFFRKVGFYDRTHVELRERGMPQVPAYWARTTVMTTAYGHGIAVTPLHLAQAYAALANGGILHDATLLKHAPGAPVPGVRVIGEATSARIRQFMRLVVLQGTGTNADAAGLRVGGKTGTAEKVEGRGYNKAANITVFSGAFPMDRPRYVVLVVLDDAKASKATAGFKTAGWMTAPLAKRIVARIGPLLGIRPEEGRDVDESDLMPLLLEKKVPGKNAIE